MRRRSPRQRLSDRGRVSHEAGKAAECSVMADYTRRGFSIARERWRGRAGEIDLIAHDGTGYVFVEVKQSRTFEQAMEHLSEHQVARLYSAVEEFLADEPNGNLTEVRFDVALVNGQGEFRILENAFA